MADRLKIGHEKLMQGVMANDEEIKSLKGEVMTLKGSQSV